MSDNTGTSYIFSGIAIGLSNLGLLLLANYIEILEDSGAFAVLLIFGIIPLISAIMPWIFGMVFSGIRFISQFELVEPPPYWRLAIISILTMAVPIFGAFFGAPDLDFEEVWTLAWISLGGGIIWGTFSQIFWNSYDGGWIGQIIDGFTERTL